jgi:hypothetical protein
MKVNSQDIKLAKSLSSGLDYSKFLPKEEKLNYKIFISNFSLSSRHFRHAIRVTVALLIGYMVSRFEILGIGHSYLDPDYHYRDPEARVRYHQAQEPVAPLWHFDWRTHRLRRTLLYYEPAILLVIMLSSMIMCLVC